MSFRHLTKGRTLQIQKPKGLRIVARFLTHAYRSVLIGLAHFKVFQVTVHGRELVPRRGRVIIACNHISIADPVFVWGALRRSAVAMAMAELWKMPVVRSLVSSVGHIPVLRDNSASGKSALDAAASVLTHEGALLIFPEGKCSADGTLLPFKTGVALLALQTGSPIVPVGIRGANEVKPLWSWKLNVRAPVTVSFGDPIEPSCFTGPDAVDQLLAKLSADILALSTTD